MGTQTEFPNGEEDDVDGLTAEDQAVITRCTADVKAPMSPMGAQREASEQRELWGEQWGTGKPRTEPNWPTTMAAQPPGV